MLDANDLKAIADLLSVHNDKLNARMDDMNDRLIARMDVMNDKLIARMDDMDDRLNKRIDNLDAKIDKLEAELYDEMDRYDRQNQRSFNEIRERLSHLETQYRISRNESDTIDLLVKSVQNLQVEIAELKQKIA